MSIDENKALVRRYWQACNKHDFDLLNELTTANFVQHDTTGDRNLRDVKAFNTLIASAFPDITAAIDDIIAEGNKVVVRMTTSGTHRGEFRGIPPTGKNVAITEMLIYRISEGKIAEGWSVSDMLGVMQQLGAVPKR